MVEFGSSGQVVRDEAGEVPAAAKTIEYKAEGKTLQPLARRYTPVRIGLIVYFVLSAIYLAALTVEIASLSLFDIDMYAIEGPVGESIGLGIASLAIGILLVFWFCVLSVSRWTHRAMTNLHIIKSPHVEMSPNWSVGWYFIPFANLFQPYLGMEQIWSGSESASGQSLTKHGRLTLWWGTWIVSNILSNISVQISESAEDIPLFLMSAGIDLVSSILILITTYTLLKITRQITDAQFEIQDGGLEATFA